MSDEKKIGRASVSVDETGRGRVVVGLTDISNSVGAGVIEFRPGRATVIKVELPMADAVARGEIELDEDTAKALEAIGWTGPDTELLRRRDLQEALGGLGWVRALVAHNGELIKRIGGEGDTVLVKVAAALGEYAPSEVKWSTMIEAITELAGRMEGLEK